ncbi:SRPBCC family protein [Fulvivirga sedimenti]|uniref:SRPBCC family protein n=1 Tax=Fulvivirga sedimenti TaxID=2879465 RepID=A0A9X1HK55_9BACT|nr:SRPBCC family protein [Fulvivirga sedimenti]MCA6073560.1 SRPBCC family protein [Fulvivirga sedimenti]
MKLISEIVINKPASQIWDFINNPAYFALWQKGYESTVQISGSPGVEGSTAQHVYIENGKKFTFTEEVLKTEPPESISVVLDHPVMSYAITTTLTPHQDITNVKMSNQVTLKAFSFKVLAPFLKKTFLKRQDEDLSRLKTVLESRKPDSDDDPV